MIVKSAKSASGRVLHWVLGLLGLVILAFTLLVLYVFNSHWFPRLDLPAFDERKAALLTPAKRAAYEQELFSELDNWNMGGKRYVDTAGITRREERWKEMAEDGFELAHVTLRVLKPSSGITYSLYWPMRRLEQLAEKGDVGAMCLMVALVNKAAAVQDWKPYHDENKKWLEEGARRGHPECLSQLGARLLQQDVPGYERDVKRGLQLQFAARRAGYEHDVGSLVLHYRSLSLDDPQNLRRLYCWSGFADRQWTPDRDYSRTANLIADIRRRHPGGADPVWDKFIGELSATKITLDECIKLGQGD